MILALLSVIDSCRRHPIKFDILYHNLSTHTDTTETPLAQFENEHCNYRISKDEQLLYQHNNANDIAYWRFLLDKDEQVFNESVKELEQVRINLLTEVFISTSMSSR